MGYVQIQTRRPGFARLAASVAVSAVILTLIAMYVGNAYREELNIPCSLVERLTHTDIPGHIHAIHHLAAGITCLPGA